MTDSVASTLPPRQTAGALLREARMRQGVHIAALSAAVKVPPAKLEALEADRYDELPDTTFTRALAKTICRVLKTDSDPVLALLPGTRPGGLERVEGGLNMPFRDRSDRGDPANWVPWRQPVPWAVALLLLAAAAFVLVPMQTDFSLPTRASLGGSSSGKASDSATVAASPPPEGVSTTTVAAPADVPVPPLAASAATGAAAGANAPLAPAAGAAATVAAAAADAAASAPAGDTAVLHAVKDSWIQATDASGQVLMARLLPAGETVELTGTLPLRVRIGNVAGTELSFRGQPVTLTSPRRDNIANVVLQ